MGDLELVCMYCTVLYSTYSTYTCCTVHPCAKRMYIQARAWLEGSPGAELRQTGGALCGLVGGGGARSA